MDGTRIEFDTKKMVRNQIISIIVNLVISMGVLALVLIGAATFPPTYRIILELMIILGITELTFTITGAARFFLHMRNAIRSIVLTEESITVNDDTYLNSTDYDVRYVIGFGFAGMDLSVFNVYGTILIVKDEGSKTRKTYWMGPIGDKEARAKRNEFKKALFDICNSDLKKSTDKAFDENTAEGETVIEFPCDKIKKSLIMACAGSFVCGLFLLVLAVFSPGSLGMSFQIFLAVTWLAFASIITVSAVGNYRTLARKITVNDAGITVNGEFYDWKLNPKIRIGTPSGKPATQRNENMYLTIDCFGKRSRYWVGASAHIESRRARALLITALKKYDPASQDRSL